MKAPISRDASGARISADRPQIASETMPQVHGPARGPDKNGYRCTILSLLILLMMAPTVIVILTEAAFQEATKDTHDETGDLFEGFQQAICSSESEDLDQSTRQRSGCQPASFVQYMDIMTNATLDIFDEALEVLEVYDDALVLLQDTADDLQTQEDELRDIDTFIDNVRAGRVALVAAFDGLELDGGIADLSSVDPDVTSNDPELHPDSDPDHITADLAVAAIVEVYEPVNQALADIVSDVEDVDDTVQEIRFAVDDDPNTGDLNYRQEIVEDIIGEIRRVFLDINADTIRIQNDYDSSEDDLDQGLLYKTYATYGLAMLPLVILVITTLCSWGHDAPWPLGFNICFTVLFLWYFVLLAIFVSLAGILLNDSCEYHLAVTETNIGNASFTLVDEEVFVYEAFESTLRCQELEDPPARNETFPWARPDNNLIDIWGVGSVLDLTNVTDPLLDDLQEVIDGVDVNDLLDQANIDFSTGLPVTITVASIDVTVDDPAAFYFADRGNMTQYLLDVDAVVAEAVLIGGSTQTLAEAFLAAAQAYEVVVNEFERVAGPTDRAEDTLDTAVNEAEALLDEVQEGLDDVLDLVRALVLLVEQANNFILCGFIGSYYEDTIETTICEDLKDPFSQAYLPFAVNVLGMALIVMVVSRYFVRERFLLKMQRRKPEFATIVAQTFHSEQNVVEVDADQVIPVGGGESKGGPEGKTINEDEIEYYRPVVRLSTGVSPAPHTSVDKSAGEQGF
eukprot:scaffold764_cov248-Pinguiococcus_pyrenoidosus.AAC.3